MMHQLKKWQKIYPWIPRTVVILRLLLGVIISLFELSFPIQRYLCFPYGLFLLRDFFYQLDLPIIVFIIVELVNIAALLCSYACTCNVIWHLCRKVKWLNAFFVGFLAIDLTALLFAGLIGVPSDCSIIFSVIIDILFLPYYLISLKVPESVEGSK